MPVKFPKFVKVASLKGSRAYLLQVIGFFQQALNFTYEIVHPGDEQNGIRLKNGTWTGIFGLLQRGEIDFALQNLAPTEERMLVADFSFPHSYEDMTFVTNKPTKVHSTFTIVYPFSSYLWLAVFIFFVLMSVVLHKLLLDKGTYLDLLTRMLGSLLRQSFHYDSRRTTKRLLIISWVIGVFFLTQSYQGTLLSFLTVPSYEGIRNGQELVKAITKGTCFAKTVSNRYFVDKFMDSPDKNMRIIGKSMIEHEDIPLIDPDSVLRNYKAAYFYTRRWLYLFKVNYYVSSDSFFFVMGAFAYRKDFCCKTELNEVVMRIFETGLYEKLIWTNAQLKLEINQTKSINETEYDLAPLNMADVAGAFYFLLFGYILSLVVFIIEKLFYAKLRRGRNQ